MSRAPEGMQITYVLKKNKLNGSTVFKFCFKFCQIFRFSFHFTHRSRFWLLENFFEKVTGVSTLMTATLVIVDRLLAVTR